LVRVALLSDEQCVVDIVNQVKDRFNLTFVLMKKVATGDTETALAEAEAGDTDVIISCGIPFSAERGLAQFLVIPIELTAQDVGRLVSDSTLRLNARKPEIALLLRSGVFHRLSSVDGLDPEIKVFVIDEFESCYDAATAAKASGARIIIGTHEACACAEQLDVPALALCPGREAVLSALSGVELFSRAFTLARRLAAENAAIMDGAFNGIIIIDHRGGILHINDSAKSMIDCKDKTVIGLYLLNVFPMFEKEELDSVLTKGEHLFSSSIKVRNGTLITKVDPINNSGEIIGAVLIMQRGLTAPKRLSRSQGEMCTTGFVAHQRFEDFSYSSLNYGRLIKQAKAVAYTDAPILLRGEEGTELLSLAQCIHNESSRHDRNFVEVECNAWMPEHLDEALFGIKHSLDGEAARKCLIELAEEGTLFLNHIERLSNELQFRVCRLIRGQFTLNSDGRRSAANVRVIAAVCEDLKELMAADEFRSDLYYALNVVLLEVPSLRERKEDIDDWVEFFFDYYCDAYSKPVLLSKGALQSICDHDWPGNVTQLENFCQRVILMTPHRNISEAFVRSELEKTDQTPPAADPYSSAVVHKDKEAQRIAEALKHNQGNRIKTASELGISKTTLWRLMQKHGITTDFKA
jgi:transcriptional regulator with PAS, ATPase and Fis domain